MKKTSGTSVDGASSLDLDLLHDEEDQLEAAAIMTEQTEDTSSLLNPSSAFLNTINEVTESSFIGNRAHVTKEPRNTLTASPCKRKKENAVK